jgi:hypothetical protein
MCSGLQITPGSGTQARRLVADLMHITFEDRIWRRMPLVCGESNPEDRRVVSLNTRSDP